MHKIKNYNYSYTVKPIGKQENGEDAYEAIIPKFPGMLVMGGSLQELHEGVMISIEYAIEKLKKAGKKIPPEDRKKDLCNGKILLRVKPEMHEKLLIAALRKGVSLNKYLTGKLLKSL